MNNDITKKKPSKMPERVLGTEEIQRCLRHSYSTFTDEGGKSQIMYHVCIAISYNFARKINFNVLYHLTPMSSWTPFLLL